MTAESASLASILLPDGKAFGQGREDPSIRFTKGGPADAIALYAQLAAGGSVAGGTGLTVQRSDGATVTLTAEANLTAIDITGGDVWITRVEFETDPGRDGGMEG